MFGFRVQDSHLFRGIQLGSDTPHEAQKGTLLGSKGFHRVILSGPIPQALRGAGVLIEMFLAKRREYAQLCRCILLYTYSIYIYIHIHTYTEDTCAHVAVCL